MTRTSRLHAGVTVAGLIKTFSVYMRKKADGVVRLCNSVKSFTLSCVQDEA
jgi:hypothetical protein